MVALNASPERPQGNKSAYTRKPNISRLAQRLWACQYLLRNPSIPN
jgi:hypothetical protein